MTAIWGFRRHKQWMPVVATIIFLVGASLALFNLVVSEYGTQIFPTSWGVLGLVPSIAGLVAAVLLWTRGRAKEES